MLKITELYLSDVADSDGWFNQAIDECFTVPDLIFNNDK
jgi:hypothetical protein